MANQTGTGILVAYKAQPTKGTAPGAAGGKRLRLNSSPGLSLQRATILPGEIRSDRQSPMGRLGSKTVQGSYTADLSVGSFDEWLEAVMRSTWVASVALAAGVGTEYTTTANTIVRASGSWITLGVRVGDVIRGTNFPDAANNNVNLRVTAVTAAAITVAETLVANATADADAVVTVLRKLANADTPTRRAFYIEEYHEDIDQSEVFDYCRIVGFTIRGGPDAMATIEFQVMGTDADVLATGASPYYTTPTLSTAVGLVFSDGLIRFQGADIAIATAFELTVTLNAATLPVIGSNTSPDVFDNRMDVSGSISMLRQDLDNVSAFNAETEYEMHLLLTEPESEPKDCVSIFVPRVKLSGVDAALGQDGGMIETLPFMVGKQEGVTGYDDTTMTISTSAA